MGECFELDTLDQFFNATMAQPTTVTLADALLNALAGAHSADAGGGVAAALAARLDAPLR